jgi:1-acyl-sn-glycerol-3-phosphate acyltransferase
MTVWTIITSMSSPAGSGSGDNILSHEACGALSCLEYVNGEYRTAPAEVSMLSRALPSLPFYFRLIAAIVRASGKAKRAGLSAEDLCDSCRRVLRALESAGVRFEVTGALNFMELDEPCVFVANHMSALETVVLPALTLPHKEITFVVKRSLLDLPLFGQIMRAMEPVAVSRKNPRTDLRTVLQEGTSVLRAGKSVVIFPQATRTSLFYAGEFNTLGVKLARLAKAPVIPLAIKSDAWKNGRLIKDLGIIDPSRRVHFSFGEPLRIKDRGHEEHKRVVEFISERLSQWGGPTPPLGSGT